MVMDEYVPWLDTILEIDPDEELWYVIFPSNRGGYSCQCVPHAGDMFSKRHPIPQNWHGLSDEEFQRASGIPDARWCHNNGFLMTTETLDSAIGLAKKSRRNVICAPCVSRK